MSMVSDHFKKSTVAALHRERPSIRWACCEWMVQPLVDAGVDKRVICVMNPYGESPDVAGWLYKGIGIVRPQFIPHNVPNCAWHIFVSKDGKTGIDVFYATDTSSIDEVEAKDYGYYFIENNHERAEIEARIAAKHAAGEFAYEEAAARNHLSREQAEDWLARNAGPNSRYIFLHQHREKENHR